MTRLEWAVEGAGLLWAFSDAWYIRESARRRVSIFPGAVASSMWTTLAVLWVPYLDYSPLHLLWLLPFCFVVLGPYTPRVFPLTLLMPFARTYGDLWCLGLGRTWRDCTPEVMETITRAEEYVAQQRRQEQSELQHQDR